MERLTHGAPAVAAGMSAPRNRGRSSLEEMRRRPSGEVPGQDSWPLPPQPSALVLKQDSSQPVRLMIDSRRPWIAFAWYVLPRARHAGGRIAAAARAGGPKARL